MASYALAILFYLAATSFAQDPTTDVDPMGAVSTSKLQIHVSSLNLSGNIMLTHK